MINKKKGILFALLALVAMFIVACQPEVVEVTKIVTETEEVVVTQVVEVEGETVVQEVVVTATPDPNAVEEEPVMEEEVEMEQIGRAHV